MQNRLSVSIFLFTALFLIASCGKPISPLPPGENPDITLVAPAGLKAVAGDHSVTLSWESVEDATFYRVFYGSNATALADGKGAKEGDSGLHATETEIVLTGLTPKTELFFAVTANAGAAEPYIQSGYSNPVSATPEGEIGEGDDPATVDELEVASIKVTVEVCIDHQDRLKIKDGKMQFEHVAGDSLPGAGGNCGAFNYARVTETDDGVNLFAPEAYKAWVLPTWTGNSSSTFDMQLDKLAAGKFNRVANLRLISARDPDVFLEDGNNIAIRDDSFSGAATYKIEFEYWFSRKTGKTILASEALTTKSAKVEVKVCVDDKDDLRIQEGKLVFESGGTYKPASHFSCTFKDVQVKVDNIFVPYAIWVLSWPAGSKLSDAFDMQLSGLVTGNFSRIANLKKLDGRGSVSLGGQVGESANNEIYISDSFSNADTYQFEFEYWYTAK